MIKLVKVNKYFNRFKRNKIHVINNTSLEFEKTGLVAILGNSGSGKTTLLNAIGGLDKVSSGKIYINGKKITKRFSGRVDKIRNLNIGYIFQNYNLINNMTVFDNVALALKMCGVKNKEEIKKRVNYLLEVLGIYKYRNRYANMISGGERQRVAIARALVKNPNIIIADEPTGNLDSKNSLEIMNIIKSISKNKLVILVTHEKELALFVRMAKIEKPKNKDDVPTYVLLPAFILSELKTAFTIGFVVYLPFLVIDIVVSSVLVSMGMMFLPPTMIALPFKLIMFVMVDGWYLVVKSLVESFVR